MENKNLKTNFNERINSEEAQKIKENLTNFLLIEFPSYQNKFTRKEVAQKIQDKILELINIYIKIFKINLEKDEFAYNEICNGFESIITKKIYNEIFNISPEEVKEDFEFQKKLLKYNFIKPEYLEIPQNMINPVYIETAINSKKNNF